MADDTDSARAYARTWRSEGHETIGPNMMLELADKVDELRDRAEDDARDRERLRVNFNARAAEASRLRDVIENAPHGYDCPSAVPGHQFNGPCTCWKEDIA